MFPNFYYVFKDLLGLEIPALVFVNTFGFFVAIAFLLANYTMRLELKRKEEEGLLQGTPAKQWFGKLPTAMDYISNAAMGLSIPLAIGSSVGSKNKQILAVTGDGSLELNIQELTTISHYNLNIKLFVINNGGYVSMHNWTDKFFEGRRVDNKKDTGEGTLNLKNIAKAFDLKYYKISSYKSIDKDLKNICKTNSPIFVEVVTDNKQIIFDSFKDK